MKVNPRVGELAEAHHAIYVMLCDMANNHNLTAAELIHILAKEIANLTRTSNELNKE